MIDFTSINSVLSSEYSRIVSQLHEPVDLEGDNAFTSQIEPSGGTPTTTQDEPVQQTGNVSVTNNAILSHMKPSSTTQYADYIEEASEKYGVPVNLINHVIEAESSFNSDAVSKAGAIGLMQLMPSTAASLGVNNPYNPEENIDGGVKYLKQMFDRFGRWDYALAAYNAGAGAVEKYNGIPPYPETQAYVKKILGE